MRDAFRLVGSLLVLALVTLYLDRRARR